MKRTLSIAALALIGLTTACAPAPNTARVSETRPLVLEALAPCATEDSPGPCYWDATQQGNGQGNSFTVDANQHVTMEGK